MLLLLLHFLVLTFAAAVAAANVVVGAAVALNVVPPVRSHFRAHQRLCVNVNRRRSAAGDVDTRRVRFDDGGD